MANNELPFPLTGIATDSANLPCPVGTEYDDGYGSVYRFVKFLDAVTYVVGYSVAWANAAATAVSNDRSGGSSLTGNRPAGIVLAIMTQNSWGWIQRKGPNLVVKMNNDDDAAIGDTLILDTAADGVNNTVAAGTTAYEQHQMGRIAVAVDAATNIAGAVLDCPL